MRQESRFVAELYRYLAPFIDTGKQFCLSLDGIAARKGVLEEVFADPDVPDLWFTLVGDESAVLIEAKILTGKRIVTLSQGQLAAWRSTGPGRHKPAAWVAANEDFREFRYWSHTDFVPILDACRSTVRYPRVTIPSHARAFADVRPLALHILRQASNAPERT